MRSLTEYCRLAPAEAQVCPSGLRLGERETGFEQALKSGCRQGPGEIEALGQIAAHLPQFRELSGGLHSLSGHGEPERAGKGHYGLHEGHVAGGFPGAADEGAVDLETVYR